MVRQFQVNNLLLAMKKVIYMYMMFMKASQIVDQMSGLNCQGVISFFCQSEGKGELNSLLTSPIYIIPEVKEKETFLKV